MPLVLVDKRWDMFVITRSKSSIYILNLILKDKLWWLLQEQLQRKSIMGAEVPVPVMTLNRH
ncbi:hypothetical protein D3C84_1239490 [compost metagenome]